MLSLTAAADCCRCSLSLPLLPCVRLHGPLRVAHWEQRVAPEPAAVKGSQMSSHRAVGPLTAAASRAWAEGMNDTEVTMLDATHTQNSGLIAHRVALDAAAMALKLAGSIPAPMRSLADQVVRSASSVPANLAEGAGRSGRDRTYHWRVAYASALEVGSHLELLMAAGAVDAGQARAAAELFDRARALTWRLLGSKRMRWP